MEDHRCYQIIQNLPEEYDYLVRKFDKIGDEKFKFENIKSEILKEFSRREIQECQQDESFIASKPIVTSSSNNPSASGENKINLLTGL